MSSISETRPLISQTANQTASQTSFLDNVVNTGYAVITELFAMCFYFPRHYLSGNAETFTPYGINPKTLDAEQLKLPALLFLHGDHHNQSGVLPLAYKIEQYRKTSPLGPLFTVNLSYNEQHPENHRKQLADRIDQIKQLYAKHGKPFKLILIGHSKGAIEAVQYAYITPHADVVVEKVISIAGRLKVIDSYGRRCHPDLQPQIKPFEQAIKDKPEIPLHTAVAEKDWIMHPDSAYIDPKRSIFLKNRSHLGILGSDEALDQVIRWLAV